MATRKSHWALKVPESVNIGIVTMDHELWGTCEAVEYEVFTDPDTGYYPKNDAGRILDFDGFGRQEFVAASIAGRVVGVMRLVFSEEKKMREGLFQTYDHRGELHMFPEMIEALESLDPRMMVDMSTMAVLLEARNSNASKAVITRTIQRIWETGRRLGLACIDTPFYRKLKVRGLDFQDLGPSTYYWGSPTTASVLDTYAVPKGMGKLSIPCFRARGYLERLRG